MTSERPSRRVFGWTARSWAFASAASFATAFVFGVWASSMPLDEPDDRRELTARFDRVTRDENGLRLVPVDAGRDVAPLWAVTLTTTATITVASRSNWLVPLECDRTGRWTYELSGNRIDSGPRSDSKDPLFLSADQLRALRPMLVDRLNRDDPAAKRGDRLATLLDAGLHESSSPVVPMATAAAFWASIATAVAALAAKFRWSRGVAV